MPDREQVGLQGVIRIAKGAKPGQAQNSPGVRKGNLGNLRLPLIFLSLIFLSHVFLQGSRTLYVAVFARTRLRWVMGEAHVSIHRRFWRALEPEALADLTA